MPELEDICMELEPSDFLSFCAQLSKQGCTITAVNEFEAKAIVWVSNSPLLQTQLVQMPQGMTCGGFQVTMLPKKSKGKVQTRLHNTTYFDLLRHCDARRKNITSWSAPTSLECPKLVYK